jgi:hypothetical protein
MSSGGLSETDRALLDFEAHRQFRFAGAKEAAIREELGLGWTAYHQRLNALLDVQAALAYQPSTVHRLRRARDERRRSRAGRVA